MDDHYTVTDKIDAGGMAEVYRGVAESIQGFKKSVAIKRILPELAKNQKFVSMFLDEAKVSLFLQHANIVQVFDIFQRAQNYFLVMEFVDGCNLKALLDSLKAKKQRINLAHAIYVALECCKALHYAHNAENPETGICLDIVHRDISPPNILISKMGEVKLVDFGLAKANSQIDTTAQGVVKGKFSYLSPEAAHGNIVDRRADIFAVGILLWEMFTGQRLFFGDTDFQTVEQVRQAKIPSISAFNPQVAPELEAIVRSALAKDPGDRYQEAADLGDALAQFLFSHRMKVTARDLATLVRATQAERATRRSLSPDSDFINILIKDEIAKEPPSGSAEYDSPTLVHQRAGSASLDPNAFVDPNEWAAECERPGHHQRSTLSQSAPQHLDALADTDGFGDFESHSSEQPRTPSNIEPLQHILEPDKTGAYRKPNNTKSSDIMAIALTALIVLLAGSLVALSFKYNLF